MRFFYFVPQRLTSPPECISQGFDRRHQASAIGISADGPNDGAGTLFVPNQEQFKVTHIDKERQQWRKIPDQDAWVGWIPDSPPGPDDLKRSQMMDGHLVELSDGNKWQIPAARRIVGENGDLRVLSAMPIQYTMNDQGEWTTGPVLNHCRRLWEIACETSELLSATETNEVEMTVVDQLDNACEILAVNYSITRFEVGVLGLLNETAIGEIISALLDLTTLKKKDTASDILNTPTGETVEHQTTAPRLQTST